MTTILVQITIKDGWCINRVWEYTPGDGPVGARKTRTWQARLCNSPESIHRRVVVFTAVGSDFGWRYIDESVDYRHDLGEAAAIIHFKKD